MKNKALTVTISNNEPTVLIMILNSIFIVGFAIHTAVTHSFNLIVFLFLFLLMIVPSFYYVFWTRTFKVTLTNDGRIFVKKLWKVREFHPEDCVNVVVRKNHTNVVESQKIDIKTLSFSFSVDSFMDGFDEFSDYLLKLIPNDKIKIKYLNTKTR